MKPLTPEFIEEGKRAIRADIEEVGEDRAFEAILQGIAAVVEVKSTRAFVEGLVLGTRKGLKYGVLAGAVGATLLWTLLTILNR